MKWWGTVSVVALLAFVSVYSIHTYKSNNQPKTILMATSTLYLHIPAFADGAMMPAKYTCDGASTSPAIEWSGVPQGAASLALIMDDPDIPAVFKEQRGISEYVHWVLFNIPATAIAIAEGGSAGVAGANGGGQQAYAGPCPPPQYEPSTHRYVFKLYALDAMLPLQSGATKDEVEKAMEGHIIAQAQYIGLYKRQ